ncbi:MAG: hypothetical protein ABIR91_01870 [Candidatus Saccharimonadales bacterium]
MRNVPDGSSFDSARGDKVVVEFRINPSTAVSVVEGVVGFNPAQLQFDGLDMGGSPFDLSIKQTVENSSIGITRAKLHPQGVKTDALIAKITFKVLGRSGVSELTLTKADAVFNCGSIHPSVKGVKIGFGSGVCLSGQLGVWPNCEVVESYSRNDATPPTTAQQTTSSKNTTLPATKAKISSIKADPQYTRFTVSATTSTASKVHLTYGTNKDALTAQTPFTGVGMKHSITVDEGLTPGSEIFYKIIAVNDTSTTVSDVQSVSLSGFAVKLTVIDSNLTAIPNQQLTMEPSGLKTSSDDNGIATFNHLAPGDYTVGFSKAGKPYRQHVTIFGNLKTNTDGIQVADEQRVALVFDGYTQQPAAALWVIVVLAAILAILIAGVVVWALRHKFAIRTFVARLSRQDAKAASLHLTASRTTSDVNGATAEDPVGSDKGNRR